MFNSSAEPNSTKSYKLERVLFKTLECFPSALFPKIWNSIELELKETKSAKSFKRKVAKIYLDSYANYICKKKLCIMWINLGGTAANCSWKIGFLIIWVNLMLFVLSLAFYLNKNMKYLWKSTWSMVHDELQWPFKNSTHESNIFLYGFR